MNYMEVVNGELAVYSRSLHLVATTTEDAFTGGSSTCDGNVNWDQQAHRFEYYSLACNQPQGSEEFFYGWSKTASPTPLTGAGANWCQYVMATGTNLEDFGKLGTSDSFLIIGANEFNDSSLGYVDSAIFVIPKPAPGLTTCPATPTVTEFVPTPGTAFSPQPARMFGRSANGYVVAMDPSSTVALRMYTIAGTPTTPTLTDDGTITVPNFGTPAPVPQPGSSDGLDALDGRLSGAAAAYDPSLRSVAVWTEHTIAGAGSGPDVVRWYELRPGRSTPVQVGTVSVKGQFVFNAAIAPTMAGNAAAISYDVGGAAMRVQVRARAHRFGTPAGSMAGEVVLASSTAVDKDFTCPSQGGLGPYCYWGSSAGASSDPNGCGATVWGTNQLNGTPVVPGNPAWETENFGLLVDECPTAAFTVTTATPAHGRPITFRAATTGDPDGSIASFTWRWGDGTSTVTTRSSVAHRYRAPGTYHVTLTERDVASLVGLVTRSVRVN